MYARVGEVSVADGTKNPLVADRTGALVMSGGFGKYRQSTLAGREHFAFCKSQNVALYTATAAIGLIVHNPALSGINVVPHLWSAVVWADSASMTGMMLAVSTQLTVPTSATAASLTGKSLITSSAGLSVGVARAYSIATVLAPVAVWPLFQNAIAVATEGAVQMHGDLDGAFAFAPGTALVIGAIGAAGVTVDLGLTWEEIPT